MNVELVKKVAKKKGWRLNTDMNYVLDIIKGLNVNREKHGRYYCPCKVVTGDIEKDSEIICPCKNAQNEIYENGICHCGLYTKILI